MVFFKLKPGDKVVETARRFAHQLQSSSKARLIYAGQAAFTVNALHLTIGNGMVCCYSSSRPGMIMSRAASMPELCWRVDLFADSYLHGMRRNRSASFVGTPVVAAAPVRKDSLPGRWYRTVAKFPGV